MVAIAISSFGLFIDQVGFVVHLDRPVSGPGSCGFCTDIVLTQQPADFACFSAVFQAIDNNGLR